MLNNNLEEMLIHSPNALDGEKLQLHFERGSDEKGGFIKIKLHRGDCCHE